jgi:beta-glucosidase-like glycosyl hydrolase
MLEHSVAVSAANPTLLNRRSVYVEASFHPMSTSLPRPHSPVCSYNAINGVPSCASRSLLTDLLREEWRCGLADGGQCLVRSDYNAIEFVSDRHHYMPSFEEAAAAAINAGCDSMTNQPAMNVTAALLAAVRGGLVTEATLDASTERLIAMNVLAAAFEPPSAVPALKQVLNASAIGSAEHAALARLAATRAITLLENRNGTLPLPRSLRGPDVAVVGPAANDSVAMQASCAHAPNSNVPSGAVRSRWCGLSDCCCCCCPISPLARDRSGPHTTCSHP